MDYAVYFNVLLDARSDLFSLGSALYQLTTGRLPFQLQLSGGGRLPVRTTPWTARAPWLVAVSVALLLGATTFFWRGQLRNAPDDDLRILPLTSLPGAEMTPAFSTDGRLLAYAWNGPQEDNFDIYVQQVGGGSPLRLTDDPASDTNPAFSRDGQWLAFVRNREDVYIKPVLGGRPERRVGRTNFAGIDFAPDGDAVAVSGPAPPGELPAGIRLVSLKDGTEQSVTNPPAGASDIEPRFSPDGQRLAFLRVTGAAVMDIHMQSVHGGPAVRVTHDNLSIEGVTWAPGGRELVFSSIRAGFGRLYRVEIDSRRVRTLSVNHGSFYPAFDVAGNRLAYNYRDLDLNIWKLEIGREDATVIPLSTGVDASPSVSPDGRRIAFASTRSGRDEIWTANVDGSDLAQVTDSSREPTGVVGSPAWSPNGRRIAFDARVGGNADIYVVDLDGGQRVRLTDSDAVDVIPSWSNDGAWIYFNSRRTGRPEIWKVSGMGGPAVQVTFNQGFAAKESADGSQLFFVRTRTASEIWQMPVTGGTERPVIDGAAGSPHLVVQFSYWAPARDGIYFVEEIREGSGPTRAVLSFYDFAAAQVRTIHRLTKPPGIGVGGLAVGPDWRTVFWTQIDRASNDILLLEGFR